MSHQCEVGTLAELNDEFDNPVEQAEHGVQEYNQRIGDVLISLYSEEDFREWYKTAYRFVVLHRPRHKRLLLFLTERICFTPHVPYCVSIIPYLAKSTLDTTSAWELSARLVQAFTRFVGGVELVNDLDEISSFASLLSGMLKTELTIQDARIVCQKIVRVIGRLGEKIKTERGTNLYSLLFVLLEVTDVLILLCANERTLREDSVSVWNMTMKILIRCNEMLVDRREVLLRVLNDFLSYTDFSLLNEFIARFLETSLGQEIEYMERLARVFANQLLGTKRRVKAETLVSFAKLLTCILISRAPIESKRAAAASLVSTLELSKEVAAEIRLVEVFECNRGIVGEENFAEIVQFLRSLCQLSHMLPAEGHRTKCVIDSLFLELVDDLVEYAIKEQRSALLIDAVSEIVSSIDASYDSKCLISTVGILLPRIPHSQVMSRQLFASLLKNDRNFRVIGTTLLENVRTSLASDNLEKERSLCAAFSVLFRIAMENGSDRTGFVNLVTPLLDFIHEKFKRFYYEIVKDMLLCFNDARYESVHERINAHFSTIVRVLDFNLVKSEEEFSKEDSLLIAEVCLLLPLKPSLLQNHADHVVRSCAVTLLNPESALYVRAAKLLDYSLRYSVTDSVKSILSRYVNRIVREAKKDEERDVLLGFIEAYYSRYKDIDCIESIGREPMSIGLMINNKRHVLSVDYESFLRVAKDSQLDTITFTFLNSVYAQEVRRLTKNKSRFYVKEVGDVANNVNIAERIDDITKNGEVSLCLAEGAVKFIDGTMLSKLLRLMAHVNLEFALQELVSLMIGCVVLKETENRVYAVSSANRLAETIARVYSEECLSVVNLIVEIGARLPFCLQRLVDTLLASNSVAPISNLCKDVFPSYVGGEAAKTASDGVDGFLDGVNNPRIDILSLLERLLKYNDVSLVQRVFRLCVLDPRTREGACKLIFSQLVTADKQSRVTGKRLLVNCSEFDRIEMYDLMPSIAMEYVRELVRLDEGSAAINLYTMSFLLRIRPPLFDYTVVVQYAESVLAFIVTQQSEELVHRSLKVLTCAACGAYADRMPDTTYDSVFATCMQLLSSPYASVRERARLGLEQLMVHRSKIKKETVTNGVKSVVYASAQVNPVSLNALCVVMQLFGNNFKPTLVSKLFSQHRKLYEHVVMRASREGVERTTALECFCASIKTLCYVPDAQEYIEAITITLLALMERICEQQLSDVLSLYLKLFNRYSQAVFALLLRRLSDETAAELCIYLMRHSEGMRSIVDAQFIETACRMNVSRLVAELIKNRVRIDTISPALFLRSKVYRTYVTKNSDLKTVLLLEQRSFIKFKREKRAASACEEEERSKNNIVNRIFNTERGGDENLGHEVLSVSRDAILSLELGSVYVLRRAFELCNDRLSKEELHGLLRKIHTVEEALYVVYVYDTLCTEEDGPRSSLYVPKLGKELPFYALLQEDTRIDALLVLGKQLSLYEILSRDDLEKSLFCQKAVSFHVRNGMELSTLLRMPTERFAHNSTRYLLPLLREIETVSVNERVPVAISSIASLLDSAPEVGLRLAELFFKSIAGRGEGERDKTKTSLSLLYSKVLNRLLYSKEDCGFVLSCPVLAYELNVVPNNLNWANSLRLAAFLKKNNLPSLFDRLLPHLFSVLSDELFSAFAAYAPQMSKDVDVRDYLSSNLALNKNVYVSLYLYNNFNVPQEASIYVAKFVAGSSLSTLSTGVQSEIEASLTKIGADPLLDTNQELFEKYLMALRNSLRNGGLVLRHLAVNVICSLVESIHLQEQSRVLALEHIRFVPRIEETRVYRFIANLVLQKKIKSRRVRRFCKLFIYSSCSSKNRTVRDGACSLLCSQVGQNKVMAVLDRELLQLDVRTWLYISIRLLLFNASCSPRMGEDSTNGSVLSDTCFYTLCNLQTIFEVVRSNPEHSILLLRSLLYDGFSNELIETSLAILQSQDEPRAVMDKIAILFACIDVSKTKNTEGLTTVLNLLLRNGYVSLLYRVAEECSLRNLSICTNLKGHTDYITGLKVCFSVIPTVGRLLYALNATERNQQLTKLHELACSGTIVPIESDFEIIRKETLLVFSEQCNWESINELAPESKKAIIALILSQKSVELKLLSEEEKSRVEDVVIHLLLNYVIKRVSHDKQRNAGANNPVAQNIAQILKNARIKLRALTRTTVFYKDYALKAQILTEASELHRIVCDPKNNSLLRFIGSLRRTVPRTEDRTSLWQLFILWRRAISEIIEYVLSLGIQEAQEIRKLLLQELLYCQLEYAKALRTRGLFDASFDELGYAYRYCDSDPAVSFMRTKEYLRTCVLARRYESGINAANDFNISRLSSKQQSELLGLKGYLMLLLNMETCSAVFSVALQLDSTYVWQFWAESFEKRYASSASVIYAREALKCYIRAYDHVEEGKIGEITLKIVALAGSEPEESKGANKDSENMRTLMGAQFTNWETWMEFVPLISDLYARTKNECYRVLLKRIGERYPEYVRYFEGEGRESEAILRTLCVKSVDVLYEQIRAIERQSYTNAERNTDKVAHANNAELRERMEELDRRLKIKEKAQSAKEYVRTRRRLLNDLYLSLVKPDALFRMNTPVLLPYYNVQGRMAMFRLKEIKNVTRMKHLTFTAVDSELNEHECVMIRCNPDAVVRRIAHRPYFNALLESNVHTKDREISFSRIAFVRLGAEHILFVGLRGRELVDLYSEFEDRGENELLDYVERSLDSVYDVQRVLTRLAYSYSLFYMEALLLSLNACTLSGAWLNPLRGEINRMVPQARREGGVCERFSGAILGMTPSVQRLFGRSGCCGPLSVGLKVVSQALSGGAANYLRLYYGQEREYAELMKRMEEIGEEPMAFINSCTMPDVVEEVVRNAFL